MFWLEMKGFSALHTAGAPPWSDSSRTQHPPAPSQGQEMQLQTAASQGLTIPGGASSLSMQRGGGFSLSKHFIVLNNFPPAFMCKYNSYVTPTDHYLDVYMK